jgi:hypothetical protein
LFLSSKVGDTLENRHLWAKRVATRIVRSLEQGVACSTAEPASRTLQRPGT